MSKAQQCFQVDSNKFWLLVLVRKCQLLQNSLTCSFKYLLTEITEIHWNAVSVEFLSIQMLSVSIEIVIFFSPWMNFWAKVSKHPYSHFEVAQMVKWLIKCLESIKLDPMSPAPVPGNPFSPRRTKFHCWNISKKTVHCGRWHFRLILHKDFRTSHVSIAVLETPINRSGLWQE